MNIHLGYEIGTGTAVSVPLAHMAVTGVTQQSGKTTTLEALVERSGRRALTFVTKRGESSFAGGNRVAPYFRDRADWQFVTSIIDATLQEKNKFLRPWIMKICRTTRTLKEVQAAVRDAMKTAKGINEGVYTQLDEYLNLIVPEIDRAQLALSLDLRPGLNVMDISGYATPMQMLFVQSAIDWINEHERDVTVVIPEAWEFIPEGKGSPVKNSAITLVRKGAGIKNFIWVDSQDMAGVDKTILRGCTDWIIGVQRESNEIKRTLANIPAGVAKPNAAEIALLERGQFFACWGRHVVKVYVQPAWMSETDARSVAVGNVSSDQFQPPKPQSKGEDPMWKERAEAAEAKVKQLEARLAALEARPQLSGSTPAPPAPAPKSFTADESFDNEAMYQAFKKRLVEEAPGILQVLTIKPELTVTVERKEITADGKSLKGRVARLIASGFMNGKKHSEVKKELERTGTEVNGGNLSTTLKDFVRDGFLTAEEGDTYQAVAGMKVRIKEGGN